MWEIDCVEAMEGDKKTHKKENRGSRTSETKLGKKLRKPGGRKNEWTGMRGKEEGKKKKWKGGSRWFEWS